MAWPSDSVRQKTEEELRLRVEEAVAELRCAIAERDRLSDLSADVADTPDGALAVRQSTARHREAMKRLREALRAFNEFAAG